MTSIDDAVRAVDNAKVATGVEWKMEVTYPISLWDDTGMIGDSRSWMVVLKVVDLPVVITDKMFYGRYPGEVFKKVISYLEKTVDNAAGSQ